SPEDADAGPSNLRDFCLGAFTADVERLRGQCSVADLSLSQSMARAAASLCTSNLSLAIARSRATFDDAAAQKCVAMLRDRQLARTSETDTLFAHAPCDRILAGLQPEGQPCRFSIECRDGLACVGYKVGVDGTCRKAPPVHAACTLQPYGTVFNEAAAGLHHPACAPAAYCDGTICQPRVPAGKPCSRSESCAAGLSCARGKCGTRAPAGEACGSTSDCVFGLWCDRSGEGGAARCASKRPEGAECTVGEACKGRCDVPKGRDGRPSGPGKCVATCGSG
ncbi:MAG: hypothetical protein ACRELB_20365, partial [Polyangiaceae bacterium]